MLNWKDFFYKFKNPYKWTLTSEAFYKIIRQFINKDDRVLEAGSSMGHISYRLAREGYNVTLLDICKEPIEIAKDIFKKNNIKATFICGDIFDHKSKYDYIWSSGLIQCFGDKDKVKFIKKVAYLTSKILLFYPDTDEMKRCGYTKEGDISRIPEIIYEYFNEIYFGKLDRLELRYSMYWVHAKR